MKKFKLFSICGAFALILALMPFLVIAQVPTIQWQKTIGTSENDWFTATQQQPTSDGGCILGGTSSAGISGYKTQDSKGGNDYWVVKLNTTGGIQWEQTIGGSGTDNLTVIQPTSDGGYILGGNSDSGVSGDKTEPSIGGNDYWVVKLSSTGAIMWQKTIGGNDNDVISVITPTSDGYLIGGQSSSGISGDKTEISRGLGDYWIVKLNLMGAPQWQKTIGGNDNDALHHITQTSDGGYTLIGLSSSGFSGDKAEISRGGQDYWAVKLNASRVIVWQKTIGGSEDERLDTPPLQTTDGGYIIGGWTTSGTSIDKTEPSRGLFDYWVVKLTPLGMIQWQKTIGGSSNDLLVDISQTSDGGFILGGQSASDASGEKNQPRKGTYDYWVVKLSSIGDIQWQNSIGGNQHQYLGSVQQTTDGGYIIGGSSGSGISGDKTEVLRGGYNDYWIVKLNSTGTIQWEKTIGGNHSDGVNRVRIKQTSSGGYILFGDSLSGISGDKTEVSRGAVDGWIIKLENASPLPLDLLHFSAEKKAEDVLLNWKTTNEQNTSHFDIQRSTDGTHFSTIGTVKSNNKTTTNDYAFTDRKLPSGTLYYRLEQVDRDGKTTFSPIRSVEKSDKFYYNISPNPTQDVLTINGNADYDLDMTVEVFNAIGSKVYQNESAVNKGTFEQKIDMTNFAEGSYIILLRLPNGFSLKKTVVKIK